MGERRGLEEHFDVVSLGLRSPLDVENTMGNFGDFHLRLLLRHPQIVLGRDLLSGSSILWASRLLTLRGYLASPRRPAQSQSVIRMSGLSVGTSLLRS